MGAQSSCHDGVEAGFSNVLKRFSAVVETVLGEHDEVHGRPASTVGRPDIMERRRCFSNHHSSWTGASASCASA